MGKQHFATAIRAVAPSPGLTVLGCGQKAAAPVAATAATANAGSGTPEVFRRALGADTASVIDAVNAPNPDLSWHAVKDADQ